MAKEKKQLTPEEKKREKERLALEKAELAERDKRKKERKKRKKRREARLKKKINKEKKRIKKEINFPYKILNLVIAISTLLILMFFLSTDMSIISILKWTAFLLLAQYMILGGAMAAYVYMLAEDKKLELKEQAKQDEMSMREEDEFIKQQELKELQDLENEIKEKRLAETLKLKNKSQKELQADNTENNIGDQALSETDLDNPILPEFQEPKESFDVEIDDNFDLKNNTSNAKVTNVTDDLELEDSNGEPEIEGFPEMKEFIPMVDYPDEENDDDIEK